ncbi:YaaC family protein [Salibacterium aidingense]|nr:YaaC family protein [Salibacterium aidingense]
MEKKQTHEYFSFYRAFESQDVLRQKLEEEYRLRGASSKEALEWSYRNTPVFHYEWLIGRTYWEEALHASLMTRPLLLFYGLAHLLKGITLISDPHYPASTDVLAHGITSRKRKKKDYTFLQDEIKVQKRGFFPHFSQLLFHMKHPYGEKWKMRDLFFKWEDLFDLYIKIHGPAALPTIQLETSQITVKHFPAMNEQAFQRLKKQLEGLSITIELIKKRTKDTALFYVEDLPAEVKHYFIEKGDKLYLPPHPLPLFKLSKISAHYLILYNLSMLCRYEGEWWGEIITQRQTEDYSFIRYYLEMVLYNAPGLLEAFFNSRGFPQ